MAEKPILGHITCPCCGQADAMAVKADKNGDPFGHCEECAGQLRVGGKPGRVRKFLRLYPWAAGEAAPVVPVTVTVTEEKAADPAPGAAPPAPPARKPRRDATFADALHFLGA